MTRRERVLTALSFEKSDKVPYQIEFTAQMRAKMPDATMQRIRNHVASAFLIKPEREIKPEYFMDEFGIVWNKTGADKDIGVVDEYLIKKPEDLDSLVIPEVDEAFIRSSMEDLLARKEDCFTMGAIGFSLFERAWTLRGMENLLCDMMEEPDFVHALLQKIMQRNMKILDIALEYDIDSFYFGDDWGQQKGLIMGPKCWRTFIKPYLAQMYAKVHKAGKFVVQHSCGDVREIMGDLAEIGLNVYQTFQPEIYTYGYAKEIFGKVSIWGGISTQRHLPVLSPEEIRAVTREMLDAFPHGGLIAGPTHAVPFDAKPENIAAMLDVLTE